MPDISQLSITGAKVQADAAQARNANCVMRLFKQGFVPTPTTLKATFETNECDFDGYLAKTIATWHDPVLAGTGYMTYAPTQTFSWALDVDAVGNVVGGHWIETAGGVLLEYSIYDPGIPCQAPGMAVIKTPIEVYPAG